MSDSGVEGCHRQRKEGYMGCHLRLDRTNPRYRDAVAQILHDFHNIWADGVQQDRLTIVNATDEDGAIKILDRAGVKYTRE